MDNKPRVVKDYDRLDSELQEKVKLAYPFGFEDYLITFYNSKGETVTALPYDGEEKVYLIRMTKILAANLIRVDDDYDDDGNLKSEVKEKYEEKYEGDEELYLEEGE